MHWEHIWEKAENFLLQITASHVNIKRKYLTKGTIYALENDKSAAEKRLYFFPFTGIVRLFSLRFAA